MGSVRQVHGGSSRRPAELAPGELVWANIINGLENPHAIGKARPVVLIEARGSAWATMGLTTKPFYRGGPPRVSVPDPRAVGLKRPGWLWSDRLCWTAGIDIEDHIGWADIPLVFEIARLTHLAGPVTKTLLDCADEHHGRPEPPALRLVPGDQV